MRNKFKYLVKIATLLAISLMCAGIILLLFFPSYLTTILEYVKEITISLGWKNYLIVAIISIIESIPFFNVIFPGAIFIIIIGWFVAQTDLLGVTAVVIICTIIGDGLAFLLWKRKWDSLLSGYWSTIWITTERLTKFKSIMKKNDSLAIFASKWTNYTRWIIPFFSGLSHTKNARFFLWNSLGSIVYWSIIVFLGKMFLGNYQLVLPYLRIIAAIVLVWTWLWYLISYYVNNHKSR